MVTNHNPSVRAGAGDAGISRKDTKSRGVGYLYIPPKKNRIFLGEWRNWQTRKFEGLVSERGCGFKSHLAHPIEGVYQIGTFAYIQGSLRELWSELTRLVWTQIYRMARLHKQMPIFPNRVSGGIGRRGSIRGCCPQWLVGSSPTSPTNLLTVRASGGIGRRGSFRHYCFGVRVRTPPCPLQRASGEIGKRGRLKICCPKGLVGSSPTLPTQKLNNMSANLNDLIKSKLFSIGEEQAETVKQEIDKLCKAESSSVDELTKLEEYLRKKMLDELAIPKERFNQ